MDLKMIYTLLKKKILKFLENSSEIHKKAMKKTVCAHGGQGYVPEFFLF